MKADEAYVNDGLGIKVHATAYKLWYSQKKKLCYVC